VLIVRQLKACLASATAEDQRAIYERLIEATLEDRLDLPRIPALVNQLRQIDPTSMTSGRRVASIVGRDPDVTARIMQVANSAQYSRRPISDLTEATTRVGLQFVKQLAVGTVIQGAVYSANGFKSEMAEYRHGGFRAGMAATLVARKTDRTLAGPAFLAGLFHDIGGVLVLRNVTDLAKQGAATEPIPTLQRTVATALGAHYANVRKLPPDISAAVGFWRRPDMAGEEHAALCWLVWSVVTALRAADDAARDACAERWPEGAPPWEVVAAAVDAVSTLR